MFVPKFTDTSQALIWVSNRISMANEAWLSYGEEASADYAWAWETQGSVLKDVHDRIITRMKAEEANMLFALNLLTLGVGGFAAGACVKKVLEKEILDKFVDKAKDWASDKAKETLKTGNEWVAKHLGGGEPAEDAFRPPGMSPAEYGGRLKKGIHSRTLLLRRLLDDVLSNPATVTLQGVQNLAEMVCNSDFIQKTPPDIGDGDLKAPALLGLWLAWAWERDVDYWEKRSGDALLFNGAEALDFEPVRQSLIKVGVPVKEISHETLIADKRGFPSDRSVLDMYAFIRWANSPRVTDLLFRDASVTTEMQKKIQYRLMLRRMTPPAFRSSVEAA